MLSFVHSGLAALFCTTMADPPKFMSEMANKIVFLALAALFLSQVWISHEKLLKKSVAYDQDVKSSMEQLYPSFTLCPEFGYDSIDPFRDVDHGLDKIFSYLKWVLSKHGLSTLRHIVKSKDGLQMN